MYFVCINFVILVRLYCFVLCMYQFCHLSEVVLFCTLYASILIVQNNINFVISVRLYCFVLCMYQFCHLSEVCTLVVCVLYFVCINFLILVRLYCFVQFSHLSVCINFVILVRLYCFVLCMYQFCHLSEVVLFCTLYVSILSS